MRKRCEDDNLNAKLVEDGIWETGVWRKCCSKIGGNYFRKLFHVVYINLNPDRNRLQAKMSKFDV